ncbi:MAG: hypothetical protein VYC34_08865 [Planctomycetota bacterium]|nr:hypothetical protein [Planctomycetota bacterium]
MPPDACFRAAPITPGPAAGHEALTAAFANADLMLRRVVETVEGAAPIRCWPHHFDIATLITLPESEFGKGRTIGVGMTPGDSTDPLPYWYVTPWPYPGNKSLPPLEGEGRWHTTGWTGALLSHSAITWSMTADAQAERLAEFLASAIAACIELQAQRPPSHR